MNTTIVVKKQRPRDYVGKDLRSPKYRMRVVDDKRRKQPKYSKQELMYEFS
jgi:hypothetical protein